MNIKALDTEEKLDTGENKTLKLKNVSLKHKMKITFILKND